MKINHYLRRFQKPYINWQNGVSFDSTYCFQRNCVTCIGIGNDDVIFICHLATGLYTSDVTFDGACREKYRSYMYKQYFDESYSTNDMYKVERCST